MIDPILHGLDVAVQHRAVSTACELWASRCTASQSSPVSLRSAMVARGG